MTTRSRPTVAFVLSGGASLGAVQVGMLRALYEQGIAPDVIVGTSAGAINGAFIASRPQTVATADALATVWSGVRRGHTFPLNPVTGVFGLLGVREHLIGNGGLRRLIAFELGAKRIYVLPAGHACALGAPPTGELAMALHAISLLTHRRLLDDIDRRRGDAHLIVLPFPCPLRIQPIDFAHADELVARALQDARAFLEGLDVQPSTHRRKTPRHPAAHRA